MDMSIGLLNNNVIDGSECSSAAFHVPATNPSDSWLFAAAPAVKSVVTIYDHGVTETGHSEFH